MTPSELGEEQKQAEREFPRLYRWWTHAIFDISPEEESTKPAFFRKLEEEDFVPPMVLSDAYLTSTKSPIAWNPQTLCTASRLSFQSFLRTGIEDFVEHFFEIPSEARRMSWARFKQEAATFPEENDRLNDLEPWLGLDYAEVENAEEEIRPWLEGLAKLAVASKFRKAEVRRTLSQPDRGQSGALTARVNAFRKSHATWCAIDPTYMQRLEGMAGYPRNQTSAIKTLTTNFSNLMQTKVGGLPRLLALPLTILISGLFVHLATRNSTEAPVDSLRSVSRLPAPGKPLSPDWRQNNIGNEVKIDIHSTLRMKGKADEELAVRSCIIGTKEDAYIALTTKDVLTGAELGRLRENFGSFSTIQQDSLALEYRVVKRLMNDEELVEVVLECEFGTVIYRRATTK